MRTSYFDVETTSFNDVVTMSCNRRQIDLHFKHFLQRRFNVNVLTSDGRRILTLQNRRLMTL